MLAVTVGCAVLGALLESISYLYRNSAAVQTYATAEGSQMRISDYIAFDVRRCLSVTSINDVLTITIPDYYGNGGLIPAAGAPPKDPTLVNGSLIYSPSPVTITYYQQGNAFYRTVNGTPTVIAENVADFTVNTATSGNAITCTTTFSPSFTLDPTAGAVAATSVFTTVCPRNVAAQQ